MPPRLGTLAFALALLILAATPFYGGNYIVHTATVVAMYAALAYSWNFIGGFTGYPSLSTAAFFGIGCYVGAIAQRHGLSLVPAWTAATVAVALFGAVLGAIILRLRGHYFAIGSFAVVEVCRLVSSSWDGVTGGGDGLNVPLLQWRPDTIASFFHFVMMTILLVVIAVTILIQRSRLGFGLRYIQQNEDAAQMVGVDATLYKVIAYTLSALFCGTIGAVYASWTGYIDPTESFQVVMTVKVPVLALLGGAGTIAGPFIGAAAFVILEEIFWVNFTDWNQAILGAVIVVLIFFLPNGLLRIDYHRFLRQSQLGTAGRLNA
jgi:branched-chain amino acid transport system permease protein